MLNRIRKIGYTLLSKHFYVGIAVGIALATLGLPFLTHAYTTYNYPSVTSSLTWNTSLYPVSKSDFLQNIEATGSRVEAFVLQRPNTANISILVSIVQNGSTLDTVQTVNTSGGAVASIGRSAYYIPIPENYDPQYDIELQVCCTYTTALYAFGSETINNADYPLVLSSSDQRRWSGAVILASTTSSGGGVQMCQFIDYNTCMKPVESVLCTADGSDFECEYTYSPTTTAIFTRNDDAVFGLAIIIAILCLFIVFILNPRWNHGTGRA